MLATKRLLPLLLLLLFFAQVSFASDIPFGEEKTYRFTYSVEIPAAKSEAEPISLWVPFPAENSVQQVLSYKIDSPLPWKLTQETKYGNRMVYISGTHGRKPLVASFTYEVKRKPYSGIPKENVAEALFSDPAAFKKALPQLAGYRQIVEIAEDQSEGLSSSTEKIDKFYNYVVDSMRYDKSGKGWGRGDPVWACSNKRGNCTDFHSLFIAMSRSQGIPARFKIGVPMPHDRTGGEVSGYHCWAEAFDPAYGWKPLDATEAKKTGKVKEYFGSLPSNRILLTQGRDIVLSPAQKGEALNFFVYPYAEVGGKPVENVKKKFSYETL